MLFDPESGVVVFYPLVNINDAERIITGADDDALNAGVMTWRRHIEQLVAFVKSSCVCASRPTRYSVEPIMSRREADIMAFASA